MMTKAFFYYQEKNYEVQCNTNEKMQIIIERFETMIEQKENNNLMFLYHDSEVNNDLTYIEQLNELDKSSKKMNIKVLKKIDPITKSKEIICPVCEENILIKINHDFKINLYGCKNNHNLNNLSLNQFEDMQKIYLNEIICENCNETCQNHLTRNGQFFICLTCNKNLCLPCKNQHEKNNNHIIIEYENKNYKCQSHGESFIKYCKKCNKDLCILYEKEHANHNPIDLGKIIPDKEELIKIKSELKYSVDEFIDKANQIIQMLKYMKNIMKIYYKINDDLINNFNISKINYYDFQNLDYLKEENKKLISKLDGIFVFDENIINVFNFSFKHFYNEKGERYLGNMNNGLKDGKGKLYYDQNSEGIRKIYEGDFKEDEADGKGFMIYKDGNTYDGDWKKNLREGQGIMIWKNDDYYSGDWKKNLREGKGTMVWKNGDKYTGDWKNDEKNGKGTMTWKNGEKYEGEWKNGEKYGKGIFIYKNGDKYDGNWENGIYEGFGEYYYNNGDIYSGYWKNNIIEGTGIFYYNNDEELKVYTGNWNSGIKEGKGTMEYKNGDVYNGSWVKDKRLGKCIMIYKNGNKYEGNWNIDKKEGKGKLHFYNGDKYEGDFKEDKIEGKGIMNYKNGNNYAGDWKDGLKNGNGVMYYSNGDRYEGEWKNDKRDGNGTLFYKNNKKDKGIWEEDKLIKKEGFFSFFN